MTSFIVWLFFFFFFFLGGGGVGGGGGVCTYANKNGHLRDGNM